MPSTPQQARFEELASTRGHEAVQVLPLPDGTHVLTALGGGDVMALEAIDAAGRRLHEVDPTGLLRRLGAQREIALLQVTQMTDAIVNAIALRQADGEELNLAEVARDCGLSRQTLYARLETAAIASKRRRAKAAA